MDNKMNAQTPYTYYVIDGHYFLPKVTTKNNAKDGITTTITWHHIPPKLPPSVKKEEKEKQPKPPKHTRGSHETK